MNTVCITGAGRGLGLGLARRYLRDGWRVFGTVRAVGVEPVVRLQGEHTGAFGPLTMDVTDAQSIKDAAQQMAEQVEALDLLINNAGVNIGDSASSLDQIAASDMLETFSVNVLGPLLCVQEFLPLLQKSPLAKVVMISSTAGSIEQSGSGSLIPYCVSKAALNMMTKRLHFLLEKYSIPILALHPGWVRTDMGGKDADLTIDSSVDGMVNVISQLTAESAIYQDYAGNRLPW